MFTNSPPIQTKKSCELITRALPSCDKMSQSLLFYFQKIRFFKKHFWKKKHLKKCSPFFLEYVKLKKLKKNLVNKKNFQHFFQKCFLKNWKKKFAGLKFHTQLGSARDKYWRLRANSELYFLHIIIILPPARARYPSTVTWSVRLTRSVRYRRRYWRGISERPRPNYSRLLDLVSVEAIMHCNLWPDLIIQILYNPELLINSGWTLTNILSQLHN